MKRLILLVVVLAFALSAVGCKSTSDHLAAIKDAGKVVVGTSADYPPFEYVDEAGVTTGFDVELMNEIGKRMGVTVEWVDMPFDSLIAAVQEGKIDMSIAAFNYDEDRDKSVDFTDAYYTTEDSFTVLEGFTGDLSDPMNLANYVVGAQSGTVQDGWFSDNLVTPGLLSEDKYFRYERVDQAALDLQAGRIEVLMADYVPAQAVISQFGGMTIVYHGVLSTGPLNIVIPEGDKALQEEINKILKELQTEGFVDALAMKYFSE
jgi:polar amino acid transport system substrate-binding protein